eukprot:Blabericola_migrator_1__11776@NODE_713_length_6760_cov_48_022561_g433_i1_p2_GENE_NODE_713_length_6760_cov_48_022561_g433_i1NODE_713_length_6760_cov_48_022561_g433_i1_p2_ORF_typecomplete_len762_score73_22_NODE_713_length_6760_cov_48_022561_g433_i111143399
MEGPAVAGSIEQHRFRLREKLWEFFKLSPTCSFEEATQELRQRYNTGRPHPPFENKLLTWGGRTVMRIVRAQLRAAQHKGLELTLEQKVPAGSVAASVVRLPPDVAFDNQAMVNQGRQHVRQPPRQSQIPLSKLMLPQDASVSPDGDSCYRSDWDASVSQRPEGPSPQKEPEQEIGVSRRESRGNPSAAKPAEQDEHTNFLYMETSRNSLQAPLSTEQRVDYPTGRPASRTPTQPKKSLGHVSECPTRGTPQAANGVKKVSSSGVSLSSISPTSLEQKRFSNDSHPELYHLSSPEASSTRREHITMPKGLTSRTESSINTHHSNGASRSSSVSSGQWSHHNRGSDRSSSISSHNSPNRVSSIEAAVNKTASGLSEHPYDDSSSKSHAESASPVSDTVSETDSGDSLSVLRQPLVQKHGALWRKQIYTLLESSGTSHTDSRSRPTHSECGLPRGRLTRREDRRQKASRDNSRDGIRSSMTEDAETPVSISSSHRRAYSYSGQSPAASSPRSQREDSSHSPPLSKRRCRRVKLIRGRRFPSSSSPLSRTRSESLSERPPQRSSDDSIQQTKRGRIYSSADVPSSGSRFRDSCHGDWSPANTLVLPLTDTSQSSDEDFKSCKAKQRRAKTKACQAGGPPRKCSSHSVSDTYDSHSDSTTSFPPAESSRNGSLESGNAKGSPLMLRVARTWSEKDSFAIDSRVLNADVGERIWALDHPQNSLRGFTFVCHPCTKARGWLPTACFVASEDDFRNLQKVFTKYGWNL